MKRSFLASGAHEKIAPFTFVKEEWIHRYVAEHDVPVNPLSKRGYKSIGCEPQTRPVENRKIF